MSWWGNGYRSGSSYTTTTSKASRRRPKDGVDLGVEVNVRLKLYERRHLKGRGESALVQYLLQHPKIEGLQISFTCRREQLPEVLEAIAENKEDIINMNDFQFETFGEMIQAVVESNLGVKLDDDIKDTLTGNSPSVRPDKREKPKSSDPLSHVRMKGED